MDILQVTRPVVEELSKKYKLVLVSNFDGNIQTILKDFGLLDFFDEIIESSVVGVRKPDPAIYRLGVDALSLIHISCYSGYEFCNVLLSLYRQGYLY